jgi:hypothetical protein
MFRLQYSQENFLYTLLYISHYQKLLLEAREFVIDAHGAWETSQGEHIVSEIDKLIEWDKKGIPHFKNA